MVGSKNRAGVLGACFIAIAASGCMPAAAVPTAPVSPAEPLPDEGALQRRLDETLDLVYRDRRLNVRDHAAWQIVHGAVAFGRDFPMEREGEIVSAVDYLLAGGTMKGWNLQPGDLLGGRPGLRAVLEAGSKTGQGHYDQWLGYLSGCNLSPDQSIVVDGKTYTLSDLIAQVEWDVPRNAAQEYSWTLMGLTAYHPTDYRWTASDGQEWTIERLVNIEAEQDLRTSACGGAHRLCGLTLAYNRHKTQGGQDTGGWKLAKDRIEQSVKTAREYQNSDGSLSSNYLDRPGRSADLVENLGATGHIFEFIVLAVPDSEIRAAWIQHAALFLCDVLQRTKNVPLECGALYHGAHGLVLYRERLFGSRAFSLAEVQRL
ncbi:MAG: ADP-ribosylation factor-directed GTPase activating protein isoform b [Pirellulaceae bacterium]